MDQHGSPFAPGSFDPQPHHSVPNRVPSADPVVSGSRKPRGDRKRPEAKEPNLRRRLLATYRGASWIIKLGLPLVLGVALALGAKAVVVDTFVIPSSSMEPTLTRGDRIAVEKMSYLLGTPSRGDLIVFESGSDGWEGAPGERYYVKRVVAVAGDEVSCCDSAGRMLVNGSPQTEKFVDRDANKRNPFDPVIVGEGEIFVAGDNRDDSYDSRFRGTVPVEKVVGHVAARIWPLERVGVVGRD